MTHTPASETPGPDHRAAVTPNVWVANPDVRKYLYLGLAAVVAALVVFGLVTEDQIADWADMTVKLLTVGAALLAAANAPKAR